MEMQWHDKVANLEVLDRAGLAKNEALFLEMQLQWTGHMICMEESQIPRQLLYRISS